jgi:hypothetical protein
MAYERKDEDNWSTFAVLDGDAEAPEEAVSRSPSHDDAAERRILREAWDPDFPRRSVDWPIFPSDTWESDPDSPSFIRRSTDWSLLPPNPQREAFNAYESLTQGKIRLLTLLPGQGDDPIHCETNTTNLESTPAYEAISYAWGTSANLVDIYFNGTSRLTRHNLTDCLRNLRYEDEPRVLWVDALCMTFSVPTPHVTEEVQYKSAKVLAIF